MLGSQDRRGVCPEVLAPLRDRAAAPEAFGAAGLGVVEGLAPTGGVCPVATCLLEEGRSGLAFLGADEAGGAFPRAEAREPCFGGGSLISHGVMPDDLGGGGGGLPIGHVLSNTCRWEPELVCSVAENSPQELPVDGHL